MKKEDSLTIESVENIIREKISQLDDGYFPISFVSFDNENAIADDAREKEIRRLLEEDEFKRIMSEFQEKFTYQYRMKFIEQEKEITRLKNRLDRFNSKFIFSQIDYKNMSYSSLCDLSSYLEKLLEGGVFNKGVRSQLSNINKEIRAREKRKSRVEKAIAIYGVLSCFVLFLLFTMATHIFVKNADVSEWVVNLAYALSSIIPIVIGLQVEKGVLLVLKYCHILYSHKHTMKFERLYIPFLTD